MPGSWLPAGPPNGTGVGVTFAANGNTTAPPTAVTLDGSYTIGSLNVTGYGANGFSLLPGTGGSLTFNNGAGSATIAAANAGPATLATGLAIAGNGALTFDVGADTPAGLPALVVSGPISGSGVALSFGRNDVLGTGGTLALTAANTFTGTLTGFHGTVRAIDGVGLPAASNLTFATSHYTQVPAVLEVPGGGTFTRTLGSGPGQVRWTGTGGFATVGGPLTVRINDGGLLNWGDPSFVPLVNQAIVLGSNLADSLVDFQNALNLPSGATANVIAVNPSNNPGNVARLSGPIRGPGRITIHGVVELTGLNTYTGDTSVNGTLRAVDGVGLPSTSFLQGGGTFEGLGPTTFTRAIGPPGLIVPGRVGAGVGFSAYNGVLTVRLADGAALRATDYGSALHFGSATGNSLVDFRNDIALNDQLTVAVDKNRNAAGDFARMGGVIRGDRTLNVIGVGTLELAGANSYTGRTVVSGVLRAADGVGLPAASSLLLSRGNPSAGRGIYEGLGPMTFTRGLGTGPGQVQVDFGGFSAHGGTMTVRLNNGTGTLTWGASSFATGGLRFGSQTADSLTDFQNDIDFGGQVRSVQVVDNPYSTGDAVRFSGVLSNGGLSLDAANFAVGNRQVAAGTLELTAANTYAGGTTVNAGRLVANHNSALGTGGVIVNSGTLEIGTGRTVSNPVTLNGGGALAVNGTYAGGLTVAGRLGGSGAVSGAVTVSGGGVVSPGNSPGRLTVGRAQFDPGSRFQFELSDAAGPAGTGFDQLAVTGDLVLRATPGNPLGVQLLSLDAAGQPGQAANFDPAQTYAWPFVTVAGTVQGFDPAEFRVDTTGFQNPSTGTFAVTLAGDGHGLLLTYTPVPEPGALSLLGATAAGLAARTWRRRRASAAGIR